MSARPLIPLKSPVQDEGTPTLRKNAHKINDLIKQASKNKSSLLGQSKTLNVDHDKFAQGVRYYKNIMSPSSLHMTAKKPPQ